MTLQSGDRLTLIFDKLRYGLLVETVEVLNGELYPITAYSQRDSRWANETLGYSGQDGLPRMTIGSDGCALCVAAMILSRFDRTITPDVLNAILQQRKGFTGANLYWERVPDLFTPPESYLLEYNGPAVRHKDGDLVWRNTAADMDRVWEELAKGPCPMEVDFYPGGTLQAHFVLATRRLAANGGDEGDIEIFDPWDGVLTALLARYGSEARPTPARWIYGLRLLQIRIE